MGRRGERRVCSPWRPCGTNDLKPYKRHGLTKIYLHPRCFRASYNQSIVAAPRRTPKNSRRVNPLRNLVAEKQRANQLARSRQRVEQLTTDLPALIHDQVGEHMQKLQDKLITDFRDMGQRAIQVSTSALNDQLNERIGTLEQVSALQTNTLGKLRESSAVAEKRVSHAVDSIEKSLSAAVPGGFKLEPSQYAGQPQIGYGHPQFQPAPPPLQLARIDPEEVAEAEGKYGFCPNCTSTKIRRSNRQGLVDHVLRFFFVAPFRCKACRHKFYKF